MRTTFIIGSRGSKLALWQAEWTQAQLRALRPDADVRIEIIKTSGDVMRDVPLAVIGGKGVFTKELEEALLAAAGLRRLGFAARISASVPTDMMLPAVGQGALGIETRANDAETNALIARLDHAPTRAACTAERALLFALGGGCQVPIAAHAV